MKCTNVILLFLLLLSQLVTGQSEILKLDEKTSVPTIFADGWVSTNMYERDIAIDPEAQILIYTLGNYKQTNRGLVTIYLESEKWVGPELLNFSGKYQDIEPFFANNGRRLYFASNRPMPGREKSSDYNIWYSDKNESGWAEPVALDTIINTTKDEYYPSVSKNGNLYFTASRGDGIGREDIFVANYKNGKFQKPQVLDSAINSKFYEFNAFINPGENLLIFSSYGRADDMGGGDLYYSVKNDKGIWQEAKNFGERINSKKLDYCPFIDFKHGIFYFTSERAKVLDKFSTVSELLEKANASQNGFGDIYRINLQELDFH